MMLIWQDFWGCQSDSPRKKLLWLLTLFAFSLNFFLQATKTFLQLHFQYMSQLINHRNIPPLPAIVCDIACYRCLGQGWLSSLPIQLLHLLVYHYSGIRDSRPGPPLFCAFGSQEDFLVPPLTHTPGPLFLLFSSLLLQSVLACLPPHRKQTKVRFAAFIGVDDMNYSMSFLAISPRISCTKIAMRC